jgi:hypothetical protein
LSLPATVAPPPPEASVGEIPPGCPCGGLTGGVFPEEAIPDLAFPPPEPPAFPITAGSAGAGVPAPAPPAVEVIVENTDGLLLLDNLELKLVKLHQDLLMEKLSMLQDLVLIL